MVELTVNGQTRSVDADPDTPLLYVLRDHLELNAAKYGCGLGQCGACTVMVDDEAVYSCVRPILLLEGRKVTTLEGLGTIEQPVTTLTVCKPRIRQQTESSRRVSVCAQEA